MDHLQGEDVTRRTVIVMGKAPEPGRVKTRMIRGGLTAEQAARVQLGCLLDLIHRDFGDARRVLHTKGQADDACWTAARGAGWLLRTQDHDDLGRNLVDAVAGVDADHILILGTDSPDLPERFIEEAWTHLASADVVIGPSFDGGYYTIGLKRAEPRLFSGISWGGSSVFAETVARANTLGLEVAVLPFWYDLDVVADLQRLRLHSGLSGAGESPYRAQHLLNLFREDPSMVDGPAQPKSEQQ